MDFIFFSGRRQGYFLASRSEVHRPPHLIIFALFQSNIYKVNVRELLSREKTDCPVEDILFPSTDLWIPNLERHHQNHNDANLYLTK